MTNFTAEVYKFFFLTLWGTQIILFGYTEQLCGTCDGDAAKKRFSEHLHDDYSKAAWCKCVDRSTMKLIQWISTTKGISGLFLELKETIKEIARTSFVRVRGAFILRPTLSEAVVIEVHKLFSLYRQGHLTEAWACTLVKTKSLQEEYPETTAHLLDLCFTCRQKRHKAIGYKCSNKKCSALEKEEETEEQEVLQSAKRFNYGNIKGLYHYPQQNHWYFRPGGEWQQITFAYEEIGAVDIEGEGGTREYQLRVLNGSCQQQSINVYAKKKQ